MEQKNQEMPGSMLSTRFCPVCGAANDNTQTHCFACGQSLVGGAQNVPDTQETLLHERYRLGATIGSGGYSAVYRGWDTQAENSMVAIKQITLQGLDAEETIEATSTYNREVEALSTLSHPQVPRLYDHFSDQDHWYLVLEYIEGQTLESYLETRAAQHRPFQMEEVIGVGLQLCTVLSYLHNCHPPVIFRDVKPDNIMRAPSGKLYLIDFGIARHYIPGQSRDTQSLGSPGYAAPEQYGRAQTDTRTDLYGLGALLHQMLSGQDPSATPRGLPPLHLNGQPGSIEMEKLVNHLLASSPQNRPASAHDVARELERIRHQRVNALDRTRIWRPPVPQNYPVSGVVPGSIRQQYQAMQQATQLKRKRLTRRKMVMGIAGASAAVVLLVGGVGAYSSFASRATGGSQPALASVSSAHIYTYTGHAADVTSLAWSSDGQRVASASVDTTVQIWDAQNGRDIYTYTGHDHPVNSIAWSSQHRGYNMASVDNEGSVRFWSTLNPPEGDFAAGGATPVWMLAWSPFLARKSVAAGTRSGDIIILGIEPFQMSYVDQGAKAINSVAYSPDGVYLSVGRQDQGVETWDVQAQKKVYATYKGHTDQVTSVNWLPNGTQLVSGSADHTVQIWAVVDGNTLLTYKGHSATINAVAPSPDGFYIASASDDGTVQVWSVFNGNTVMTYTGHTAQVTCVAWSPDGHMLASGSRDKTVQVWNGPSTLS